MLACIRCGLCLLACPTYVLSMHESEGPRGRVGMARAIAEGHLGVTADLVEHPTAETIKAAVALGMGVAVLPESVVVEDVGAGRLMARRFGGWADASRTVRVLVRAEGAIAPPVQTLIRLLQERYG
jgi:DNA-binding transcriptional LysR family regulator